MTTLSLGDISITAADTYTTDWVDVDDGASEVLIEARLLYGSGGTSATLYVQTQLPSGATMDVACFAFTTANATRVINLSRRTSQTTPLTPGDGALTNDSAVDGVIGSKLRSKVVTVGTYAGSSIVSVRAQTT